MMRLGSMDARALLPGGTRLCLVEYYVLQQETVILILKPDCNEPIVLRRNLRSKTLSECVARLVEDFSPENINPSHPEWTTDLEYIRPIAEALIGPVREHLADADVVYIIPHGHLFYLPFHTFAMGDGRCLIDEKPVVYTPSAVLLENARLLRRTERPTSFLGVGVGRATDPPARRRDFESEVEALALHEYWGRRETLLGDAALKTSFLDKGGAFDVLHFACHGRFNPADPLDSALECADSLLPAGEIAGLRLKAHLVYLSACVSGRHDVRPGDEILGLTRVFIRAGVATIAASLWPIAGSGPTRLLMERFYEAWLVRKLSKAQAMQYAQLETKKQFPHPYHWAPFVLVGDWA
jgi:CHAT domain-containing protein